MANFDIPLLRLTLDLIARRSLSPSNRAKALMASAALEGLDCARPGWEQDVATSADPLARLDALLRAEDWLTVNQLFSFIKELTDHETQ